MPKTWLILDCNYLCHRAYHALGALSHGAEATGTIYGFLNTVNALHEQFNTPNIAFCWDYGRGQREVYDPRYKQPRRDAEAKWDDAERGRRGQFRCQMKKLRAKYLRMIGYRCIYYQYGYEADDVIASLVLHTLGPDDEAIIVCSDKDLYQLLAPNVRIWNPSQNKTVTLQSFYQEWGIGPRRWPMVKAMAGCPSDNVIGLAGVGEVTAARYLRNELPPHHKAYKAIHENPRAWRPNLALVTLPWPGIDQWEFMVDAVTPAGWDSVTTRLGMRSLDGRMGARGWGRKGLVR